MKVLVVDDHVLFRQGLVSLLECESDFQVVGQAGTSREAVEKARKLHPDMILMDFGLPDSSGIDAADAILSEQPDCSIIFLTVHADETKLIEAVRSGAKGYLLKNVPITQLLKSLRSVQEGQAAISRSMMTSVMAELARIAGHVQPEQAILEKLSTRELDVLRELTTGASNQEIAHRLVISENTVKHHIHSMLDKLDMENRYQLAKTAIQNGLRSHYDGFQMDAYTR
jgi:two-component system nitrate/nitrite response regulator NarL